MSKAGDGILSGAREALAYARGARHGFKVHIPAEVDIRAIRGRTGLSQMKFATRYGFSVDSLRNWEQGRRRPDPAARAYLMIIEREPAAVERALARGPRDETTDRRKIGRTKEVA